MRNTGEIHTAREIYRHVYGPGQVATAWALDDKLAELKGLFHLPLWRFEPNKGWPCRLKQAGDRPRALALIDELESLSRGLSARAPVETAIDPARLESVYLEPLRTTLVYARKMTLLEYPEDWAVDVEDCLFSLLDEGQLTAAEQALTAARDRLQQQLARIADELQGLKGISQYRTHWENRTVHVLSPLAMNMSWTAATGLLAMAPSAAMQSQRVQDDGAVGQADVAGPIADLHEHPVGPLPIGQRDRLGGGEGLPGTEPIFGVAVHGEPGW